MSNNFTAEGYVHSLTEPYFRNIGEDYVQARELTLDCDGMQFRCYIDTRQRQIYDVLDGLDYHYFYRLHGHFAGIGGPDPVFVIQYLYVRLDTPVDAREWLPVSEVFGYVKKGKVASAEAAVDAEPRCTEDDIPF